MLQVTKSYLPSFERYAERIKKLWDTHWLTNNGSMVLELEDKLKQITQNPYLLFTNNGTIVLQMALKALAITKEVITTPFSYVATTNAILWENCTPVFVDIQEHDFNIDVEKIEEKIGPDTEAILVTHVFGNPCNVDALQQLATRHGLKLIYDAAHTFGISLNGKSIFSYGDISTSSFHATKVFHTVEGGMITCNNPELFRTLKLMRSFGHFGDEYFSVGINAKSSEFHAAMGLCVLEDLDQIIAARKQITGWYNEYLKNHAVLQFPRSTLLFEYNYAYYPVVFPSEEIALKVAKALKENDIIVRRYFYPSLNTLPFLEQRQNCPISERISSCILSLPLSMYTTQEEVKKVCTVLLNQLT